MYDLIIRTAKIEERTAESAQNVPNDELISKKSAIDTMCAACWDWCDEGVCKRVSALQQLPPAQPTLDGYRVYYKHSQARV